MDVSDNLARQLHFYADYRNEFQRCETTRNKPFPALGIHVLDSMHIFHTHEPRNLKAAYKFYCGKEHTGAHNALDDAKVALEVLEAQVTYTTYSLVH